MKTQISFAYIFLRKEQHPLIKHQTKITLKVIKKHENIFSSIEAKNYDFQADLKNDVYAMELPPVGREIIK